VVALGAVVTDAVNPRLTRRASRISTELNKFAYNFQITRYDCTSAPLPFCFTYISESHNKFS
jgi:hypothetical protein